MDVRAYADQEFEKQKATFEGFALSYEWLGRSSNPPNHALTQHFADVLEAKGLIEERVTKQIYSVDDARFLPDRYVEGTCPHCGFERARGDQCENCGKLLNAADIIAQILRQVAERVAPRSGGVHAMIPPRDISGRQVMDVFIAADEGVMPQTEEHLAILDLLEIPRGVSIVSGRRRTSTGRRV